MTREKAIEILKEYIDHLQTAINQANKESDEAFDREQARKDIAAFRIAIQAIKEQLETDDSWI